MSTTEWVVRRIGTVTSGGAEAIDDDWGEVTATIALDPAVRRAVGGRPRRVQPRGGGVPLRPGRPRRVCEYHAATRGGNPDWPEVGIFAQRAKDRPNRIGLSTCELVAVDGASIVVRGLDAIDGTPVLDVKPYMLEFGPRDEVRQPVWSHELMRGYW